MNSKPAEWWERRAGRPRACTALLDAVQEYANQPVGMLGRRMIGGLKEAEFKKALIKK